MLSEVAYDGTLSATAYIVLFSVLLLIFGGLAWCIYRAINAAGGAAPERQEADGGAGQA